MTREPLPDRRMSTNFTFNVNGKREHGTVGYYDDGRIGEVFLDIEKPGTDVNVASRESAVTASLALQYGAPVETICHALPHHEDGPAEGWLGQFLDMLVQEGRGA